MAADLDDYGMFKRSCTELKKDLMRLTNALSASAARQRPRLDDGEVKVMEWHIGALKRMIENAEDALRSIEKRVDDIQDPDARDAIYRHYICGQSIPGISMELHYAEQTIWKRITTGRKAFNTMTAPEERGLRRKTRG